MDGNGRPMEYGQCRIYRTCPQLYRPINVPTQITTFVLRSTFFTTGNSNNILKFLKTKLLSTRAALWAPAYATFALACHWA